MIGKHIRNPKGRSSFRGLNDYITGKSKRQQPGEKIACTGCVNLFSVETATLEMESCASENRLSADPVMHLLLSWRENETPTPEQALQAVEITLDELCLSQCQAVYSLHQNTDNLHLHVCVNRIDPETYRAVDPAHGWTRNAMERAARRVEHAQGWQVEANARSEIDSTGRVVPKMNIIKEKIPQEALDAENLTGEQSAVRKAQEALHGFIAGIRDWGGLHGLMSSKGMRYEKKGSGAVIRVGDIAVKASSVSRSLSLKKLEKTLGEYRPPTDNARADAPDTSEDAEITEREKISRPKPLGKSNDSPGWRAYITERKSYYKERKQLRERLSMSQREEKEKMRNRHAAERAGLFSSLKGKGYSRQHIAGQRSLLASKHAYESGVLKESQASARKELQGRHGVYSSYERWLRERGNASEADAWRHRKDGAFLQLENPGLDSQGTGTTEPKGLAGFNMAVTKQGVRFYRESAPHEASFIDTGRLIRVYRQDGDTLLAALRLAQEKWGGVKINGTDEYKRKCAEIAAKNGIRVSNPELSPIVREFERKTRPPMSVEAARKAIEAETRSLEARHWKAWDSYMTHKKALDALTASEPEKPKLFGFGVGKWRARHGEWESERDRLLGSLNSCLETLGVRPAADGTDTGRAHREAAVRHERCKEYAAKEALRLCPDAAAAVREDDARIGREERARREAEEAKERLEKESRRRFRAAIQGLAGQYGKQALIITDALEGGTYDGLLLGTAGRDGYDYAVQLIDEGRVILHGIGKGDLAKIRFWSGKNVGIKCLGGRIGAIEEERERSERSRSRGR